MSSIKFTIDSSGEVVFTAGTLGVVAAMPPAERGQLIDRISDISVLMRRLPPPLVLTPRYREAAAPPVAKKAEKTKPSVADLAVSDRMREAINLIAQRAATNNPVKIGELHGRTTGALRRRRLLEKSTGDGGSLALTPRGQKLAS